MSQAPLYLTARDFDAYAPEKATSNAFSRPRLELKQRALAWAKRVSPRLEGAGLSVEVQASDEHPSMRNRKRVDCQWVFFCRDAAAREDLDRLLDRGRSILELVDDPSPYGRHAFLALKIDDARVEVCFAVHPEAKVDRENLEARLASANEEAPLAAELTEALRMLPEEFAIGAGDERSPCSAATCESIKGSLDRAAAGTVPLWIGWSVPRETALEHAAIMDEQLEDALVALAPIYRLVAWSKDNDRIGLEARLEDEGKARAKTHAVAEAETERWKADVAAAKVRERDAARARGDKPTLATLFAGKRAAAKSESIESRVKASYTTAASAAKPLPVPQRETRTSGVIEKGAKVRVLRGPFASKLGVVGELDGRGAARVMLGLLSTKLDLGDLELAGDDKTRPSMQSSHRRPTKEAPRKAR